MPERKWFKERPIRRTKSLRDGMIRIIFDDGPIGTPGDTTTVSEEVYKGNDPVTNMPNIRREFIENTKAANENTEANVSAKAAMPVA